MRLLAHHVLEDVEEGIRHDPGVAHELEEAEGAEGVEALLEAEVDELGQRVRAHLHVDLVGG